MLHRRVDSSVYRLAKFEMNSTRFYDFTKLYWNGLEYQMVPINHEAKCKYKTEESTMINKWQFKIVLKWIPAAMENKNTIHLNVCSDSYTINSESLMRMADETLVSDFTHMQFLEPNLYTMQELMSKNHISSGSKFGRMNQKLVPKEKGNPMSDDLLAFSSKMETNTYLNLFDSVDMETMFATMLSAVVESQEEEQEELMDLTMLDEEMMVKLRSMMEEENQMTIHETPAWERKSINEIIGDMVMKFQEKEMSIAFKKILRLFDRAQDQESADKVWSILATEILLAFSGLEEFMARVVLISVYKSVSRRKRVLPPKDVYVIEDYRLPHAPLISSTVVEEYDYMMMAL
jgi:hypothetical protein